MPQWTNESQDTLYVTADRTQLAKEGSPEAAFVLVGPGGQLPEAEARRLGLLKNATPAEGKAVAGPPENKARHASESK